ncbi:MAG: L-histidine N(alpha)-methyltransferase [Candidatus Pacebacteria bacterium]|nr:L-histidine N(alpha)-methyltransferase [Candidatus Paceibacterota bacterium]
MQTTVTAGYEVLSTLEADSARSSFFLDVKKGLLQNPKRVPSKYFYDDEGSRLFRRITSLPEYYPTRVEAGILGTNALALGEQFAGQRLNVIELGAGASEKTDILLRGISSHVEDVVYRPVDISEEAMITLRDRMEVFGKTVSMRGIVGDYIDGLRAIVKQNGGRTNLIVFLGSNIGNLTDQEAAEFLLSVRSTMSAKDRLLIGFDLKKNLQVLHDAYDDSKGVTAEFNYNLLHRINRELEGDFVVSQFVHHPFYDPSLEAMVSWLVSSVDQSVRFGVGSERQEVTFNEGEGVRTEMSRKFSLSDIARLAHRTQFSVAKSFEDQKSWFADSLWQPLY